METLNKLFGWLKSVYSESDGTGSSTRLHIGLLIAFVISVGVSFAHLVHIHVLTVEQFNGYLSASGTFLVTVCGVLYGANKLADWAKGNSKDSQPPQQ